MAIEKQGKARKLLVKYLRTYPKSTSDRKRMLNLGMTAEEWSRLMEAKGRLLDSSRPLTHSDWLDDFRSEFQGLLDEVSRRRIKQYAVRVGAGTAASPIAMVDQMIVLYGCSGVVKDLLTIYQLRPAFGQTAVILSRGVVQTYLSGMVEDAMEPLADMGADSLSEFAGEGASILTGTVGRAVGAKAAEAALNGWLLHRLGRRVMTQLQPIKA